MKTDWNIDLINNYITNKVEENLHLDYKAAGSLERKDGKANELAKDVSAFANSDGGTIIYGIKENSINKHLPECIDPIDRNEITKEWIEQIIQGRITPRIQNLTITPITIKEPNHVVYVIEIPKSDTAHQSNDRKYYKRFNFNSEPMYDYEIKDILNRNKFPKIDLEFEIVHDNDSDQENFILYIYAKNNGKIYANYVNAYFTFNTKFLKSYEDKEECTDLEYFCDNTIQDVTDMTYVGFNKHKKLGPKRYDPILPRLKREFKKVYLNKVNFFEAHYQIKWVVFADNADPSVGKINLNDIVIRHQDI